MKKYLAILTILVATSASFAQSNLYKCNNNTYSVTAGLPLRSCLIDGLQKYSLGLQGDLFFVDTDILVAYKSKSYKLRFFTIKGAGNYNALMAVLQMAYTSRSKLSVIYPNPEATSVVDLNVNAFNVDKCGVNTDGDGNPACLYCPMTSVLVGE